jgi:hypothetical protein
MNKAIEITQRKCKECGGKSAYTWYTMGGKYNVVCMKCGDTWDLHWRNR